jgi:hypothetical protein
MNTIAAQLMSEFDGYTNNSIGVVARLRDDFTFHKFGVEITLYAGTLIHVDEHEMIGSHGEDLFKIDHGDYVVSYLN